MLFEVVFTKYLRIFKKRLEKLVNLSDTLAQSEPPVSVNSKDVLKKEFFLARGG